VKQFPFVLFHLAFLVFRERYKNHQYSAQTQTSFESDQGHGFHLVALPD
jgi:hypothetical protein